MPQVAGSDRNTAITPTRVALEIYQMDRGAVTSSIVPVLLAALLAAGNAGAQQTNSAASDAAACVGDGPIVGGYPRPPTPAEVRARENSPACRGEESGAPSVDFSPQAAHTLHQIYRRLMRIERGQGDSGDDGLGGE